MKNLLLFSLPSKVRSINPRLAAAAVLLGASALISAQTVGSSYGQYRVRNVADFPETSFGAIAIRPAEPNSLYLRTTEGGGEANKLYKINLVRDASNKITGTSGNFQFVANTPSGNGLVGGADGSLVYTSDGVLLYTSVNDSSLRQIKPGNTSPDKIIEGDDIEVFFGGGLVIVPPGLPGAGKLKIISGSWRNAELVPDGDGTYDIAPDSEFIDIQKNFYGSAYIPGGKVGFVNPSVLLVDDQGDKIYSYQVDARGDIIPSTEKNFITGMVNANGLTVDPVTSDILFTAGTKVYAAGIFSVVPPVVRITVPESGSSFSTQNTIFLSAEASQIGGTIAGLDYYVNATKYPAENNPPYGIGVGPLSAGQYAIVAVARDSAGLSSTSSVVNITITNIINLMPTVSLSRPAQNQSYVACDSITLRADANDPEDGDPVVEFFNGNNLLGRDSTRPYEFIITNAVPGNYAFKAVARDTQGGSSTSSMVHVAVNGPAPNHAVAVLDPITQLFCLCYNGEAGSTYVIEAKPELSSSVAWSPVVTNQAVAGSLIKYTDPASRSGKRFFRVRKGE